MAFMSGLMEQKWNMTGSATGVFVAVMLAKATDPSVAWFVGGLVMGGIMVYFGRRKASGLYVAGAMLVTGLATAMSHYALDRLI